MNQLTCKDAARRLHMFLDQELTETEIAEVQGHLENCPECRSKFHFEASFKRLVKTNASELRTPIKLRERIAKRLRQKQ